MLSKTPPEILLLTRPLTPPWDEASKNLAYSLACHLDNFRFHVLNGQPDPDLPKNVVQHQIYRGSQWKSLRQKSKLILNLSRILRQNPQIKIVHLLFAPTKLNSRLLKIILRRFPVKIIQSLACFPEKASRNISDIIFGNQAIVYSQYTSNKLQTNEIPTKVIKPFIDFTKFAVLSQEKRNKLRAEWDIKPNDKILIYPGEYSRLDAMETLWEGYKKLISNYQLPLSRGQIPNSSNIPVKLFITCRIKNKKDAALEKKFKKLVENSPYEDSVRFITKLDNPVEMYQVADLTVFPVKSMEGKFDFPFVLLESLACGTPILTSNIAALPEIWAGNDKYKEKYLFTTGDISEYSTKIQKILSEDRGNSENKLSDYVQEKFNQDKILEQYKNVYSKI